MRTGIQTIGVALACLLCPALGMAQPTSGAVGGPSNGYAGASELPRPSKQNTPVTGGGPTAQQPRNDQNGAVTGGSASSSTGTMENGTSSGAGSTTSANHPSSDFVTGRVASFDRNDQTIKLRGHSQTFQLQRDATITRDGASASMADVKEGDRVRASFAPGDHTRISSLDIMSGPRHTGATGSSSSSGR